MTLPEMSARCPVSQSRAGLSGQSRLDSRMRPFNSAEMVAIDARRLGRLDAVQDGLSVLTSRNVTNCAGRLGRLDDLNGTTRGGQCVSTAAGGVAIESEAVLASRHDDLVHNAGWRWRLDSIFQSVKP